MREDIIPSRDTDFDIFQAKVVTKSQTNQLPWGIPADALNALLAAQLFWTPSWAQAKDKKDRTSAQVKAKDNARASYEAVLRPYLQKWIVLNDNVPDSEREAMDIKPRDSHHTPVPTPTTLPVLSSLPDFGHKVKIFYKQQPDANGVSRRGKPEGVQFCEVVWSNGDVPPVNPDACVNRILSTRSPEVIDFSQAQAGGKVFYAARWINPKGEKGPWSDIQDCMIP